MNKAYLTMVLLSLFQASNVHSSVAYICANPAKEVVVHVNIYDDQKNNDFIIDSPKFEFISRQDRLQITALYDYFLVQAVSLTEQDTFAQLNLERIDMKGADITQQNFKSQIVINGRFSSAKYDLSCQAIAAKN